MASDYLLEIDGIKGESKDRKHKGSIEVLSFSWGASQAGQSGGAPNPIVGKDLHFTTKVNKASPILMQACAKGRVIPKVELFIRKAATDPADYYTITLSEVLVSSAQSEGEGSGDVPAETFSLNYTKIEFIYTPVSGSQVGTPISSEELTDVSD